MSSANPNTNIVLGLVLHPNLHELSHLMKQSKSSRKISAGVVHELPNDVENVLVDDDSALERWEDLTPLARNEWICWVEDAKKPETRQRRIERLRNDLKNGKRRPCCWPGCQHRERNGK